MQSDDKHSALDGLEIPERRKAPEAIIKVWDGFVRISHWLLVFFFAIIYLRYRKFPIHAYAGELMMLLILARFVWGFVGTKAARFSEFFFTPKQVMDYMRSATAGHARYFSSHNPMGAMMVYILLSGMFANGILGLMLYSSGQELGPLGNLVPEDWEDILKGLHKTFGHMLAAFVAMHIVGVVWAARAHRENYIGAMFTGFKRVPRHTKGHETEGYKAFDEKEVVPAPLLSFEHWFNYRHPALGSIILLGGVILVILEMVEAITNLNKYLLSY